MPPSYVIRCRHRHYRQCIRQMNEWCDSVELTDGPRPLSVHPLTDIAGRPVKRRLQCDTGNPVYHKLFIKICLDLPI